MSSKYLSQPSCKFVKKHSMSEAIVSGVQKELKDLSFLRLGTLPDFD
jgi:hypothetical protein